MWLSVFMSQQSQVKKLVGKAGLASWKAPGRLLEGETACTNLESTPFRSQCLTDPDTLEKTRKGEKGLN